MDGNPPRTLADLEAYAEATAGSLLQLTLEACGAGGHPAAAAAAAHVGRAVGIANALRALPVLARQGQRYVPDDVMAAAGLSETDLAIGDHDLASSDGRSLAEIGRAHV